MINIAQSSHNNKVKKVLEWSPLPIQLKRQGHGVILRDPGEGYQEPTTFRVEVAK